MFEIKVKTSFSAAHRLTNYEGKCANLHGHTWKIEATFRSGTLDDKGMVADFYDIKPALAVICDQLDHKYINEVTPFDEISPTSENIAKFIYEELAKNEIFGSLLHCITVAESELTAATYFGGRGDA